MDISLSKHARRRMQQRGVSAPFLQTLLENADVERDALKNCRLYSLTRGQARSLGDDRLGRFAAILSNDGGKVVTVLPVVRSRRGDRYRRRQ